MRVVLLLCFFLFAELGVSFPFLKEKPGKTSYKNAAAALHKIFAEAERTAVKHVPLVLKTSELNVLKPSEPCYFMVKTPFKSVSVLKEKTKKCHTLLPLVGVIGVQHDRLGFWAKGPEGTRLIRPILTVKCREDHKELDTFKKEVNLQLEQYKYIDFDHLQNKKPKLCFSKGGRLKFMFGGSTYIVADPIKVLHPLLYPEIKRQKFNKKVFVSLEKEFGEYSMSQKSRSYNLIVSPEFPVERSKKNVASGEQHSSTEPEGCLSWLQRELPYVDKDPTIERELSSLLNLVECELCGKDFIVAESVRAAVIAARCKVLDLRKPWYSRFGSHLRSLPGRIFRALTPKPKESHAKLHDYA